ncbi:M20 family metallopeptidase [Siminovitchia fortis]|uniref:Probable succinyl-diaminopimelate desuccinylase n=1 Tax=Siminovitchia fortis TaxID=254758 RepID=A0A443IR23_9BACI|nr:M20 family metallopeptidase [Siminovitchia fortis]RWR08617.1 M20 family peptidase [Siminovitchia fortis]WHY83141.1 M20 family metallopeptidase [Siminovitchia fortis]
MAVYDYVDDQEVIHLTQALVRIPSVYRPQDPQANESKAAQFVYDYLKEMGLEVYIEEVVKGRPNVIGILDSGRPGKTILFEGHTDVVTEGDRDSWSYDPFGAVIEGNRMYGRGTNDTKGNLSAAIAAVHAIKRSNIKWKGKIILCVPCDEEGMMIGIKHFIKRGWANGVDGAIICEPEENQICITQKGAMRAVIHTYGKMAHGAMPLAGINPNTRMAQVICKLMELEKREKERVGEHKYLGWPSITPTVILGPEKGEPQINVIPDHCYSTLDIRTVPGQDHDQLRADIENILAELASKDEDFMAEIEVIESRPWTETDLDDPIVKASVQSYRTVTGKEPIFNGVPGATDGTFLHLAGIPIVTTGAGDRHIPHQIDEYIELDELIEASRIYAQTAMLFLKQ